MADGTTKAIAEVRVGDEVIATDPETGETGPRRVTHVWPHDDWLLDLELEDGSEITTTEDHHYWNHTDQAWQESQDLDEGDLLLTADGGTVAVDGLDHTSWEWAPAYDLTVQDLHTYYVVTSDGDEEVLVHNCAAGPLRGKAATDAAKDLGFSQRIPPQKVPFNSHGQPAFFDGKRYITPDVDQHSGGVWKMFDKKGRRLGTYDANLNRIGN